MELRIPAFNFDPADWERLPAHHRALLLAAQECDRYKTEEEPRGSNRGPRVDAFLRAAHSAPGSPWCAAFVYFCLNRAGLRPEVRYPASVASWKQWAQERGRFSRRPERAGLFLWLNPDGTGHIGFVVRVGADSVETIEGNTNSGGSREGYAVARRSRTLESIRRHGGFIDLNGLEIKK